MRVSWHDAEFELLPQRAVHWPARRTLIIADAHFGKDAAFRARGVPVPGGTTAADLARLEEAIEHTGATRLLMLGDFLHAAAARSSHTLDLLSTWRAGRPSLEIVLVRGNHDAHAGDPPSEWSFQCVNEPFADDGFVFRHHQPSAAATANLRPCFAGHVHPCAILHDDDGSICRAACFHFGQRIATLPAFGGFTGMHPVRPVNGDQIFVIANGSVHDIRGVTA